jgi:hypothetical protein
LEDKYSEETRPINLPEWDWMLLHRNPSLQALLTGFHLDVDSTTLKRENIGRGRNEMNELNLF